MGNFWERRKNRRKIVADMTVNGGGGVNPLSETKYDFIFKRRKRWRMFWNVKICIWKDFKLFWNFSLKIIRFRPFWIYRYAMHIKTWLNNPSFLSVSAKTVLCHTPGGVGWESYGHVRNYYFFYAFPYLLLFYFHFLNYIPRHNVYSVYCISSV